MYSIPGYGQMINDSVRMTAYVEALRRAVRPGAVVLDIGTGPGIFALLACRFGARRVFAIEPDNIIQVAREIARANGLAERIEFIQGLSTDLTLPEPADVIISDLRSVLPLFQQHIPAIADARRRHLAPGGVLIPRQDTLWAAPVEAPAAYRRCEAPWIRNDYGLNMAPAQRLVTNLWTKEPMDADQLLAPAQPWATLDYRAITEPHVQGEAGWIVRRPGTAHGLALWFDALLAEGVGFSNAPGQPPAIYGTAFFPWPRPVELAAGDQVRCRLAARLIGPDYIWQWKTQIQPEDAPRIEFAQSTALGMTLSPAQLRRRDAGHVPERSREGEIAGFMLGLMDGQRSLGAIAQAAAARFPERFPDRQAALAWAGELSARYGA